MNRFVVCVFVSIASTCLASAQNQPPTSDPQALAYAAQSIAALTSGTTINDVTLTGNVSWSAMGADSGTATLKAFGTGESRMDLVLSEGIRTEIRDASTGTAIGQWLGQGGASGMFAYQNCMTDAVWFFPALSSLTAAPNVVLSYIGQETRNGGTVQHIQSYLYQSNQSGSGPTTQQLSTIDFYLDASTLLPVAAAFNMHPDGDANTNLPAEVDFLNYQAITGIVVPLEVQRYLQGNLVLDVSVTSASVNTGLNISNFTIN